MGCIRLHLLKRIGEVLQMSEIRYDLITGKRVIIATERGKRPHDFNVNYEGKKNNNTCPFAP